MSAGKISLGNIEVRRDFGFAEDYVEAMHLILQHTPADDYVIGTGQSHSIQEFCAVAFRRVGLDWREHVRIDPGLIRTVDSFYTRADTTKLRTVVNWTPRTEFDDLVDRMVTAQLRVLDDRNAMARMSSDGRLASPQRGSAARRRPKSKHFSPDK